LQQRDETIGLELNQYLTISPLDHVADKIKFFGFCLSANSRTSWLLETLILYIFNLQRWNDPLHR